MAAATERLTRADGTPIRVLAVDDEQSLTELLSMAMRYEGWEVRTAGTALTRWPRPAASGPTRWYST